MYHYAGNNPVRYIDPDGREDGIYVDDYGNNTTNPNKITGVNMAEAACPTINILIKFSDTKNSNGASVGSLTVYWASDKDVDLDLFGKPVLTVPIVSGNSSNPRVPSGTYKNLPQESTATSSNELLKDNAHGGPSNTMIRLPNTGGDAIHQGNNMATTASAYTEGCAGITANEFSFDPATGKTGVDSNYDAFKKALTPYGYQGVNTNVYVR